MKPIKIDPESLEKGCILAAITHAVTAGEYPELNYEHSWDGYNYCMNNSQGCRAVITFHPDYIIAVFQDDAGIDTGVNAYDFFTGAPEQIVSVATAEALQYVLEDIDGEARPLITAAFWGSRQQLFSNQTWEEIVENGGHIIETQLSDYTSGLRCWDDYYGLNNPQLQLIDLLYHQKLKAGSEPIVLSSHDADALYGDIGECIESLGELNIILRSSEPAT